jgi:hypothetical protein
MTGHEERKNCKTQKVKTPEHDVNNHGDVKGYFSLNMFYCLNNENKLS